MCFAPQRRALFRHLNFQKWSENGVFCTFWLRNVLRATTACNFSSLIWPAGSAPAALASLLFDPPEPQIIGKTQCFATFLPFSRICIFFLLIFSLLTLFTSAFQVSILSEVSLLNFLRPEGIFHHTPHRSDQTCVHRAISCETSTLLQKSCGKQCPVHPLTPSTARAYKARLGNFGWLIESTQVSMDKSGFRIISAVPGNCTCFTCFGGVAQVSLVICGYFWCLVVASCQPYWSHGHALPRLGRSRGYNMLYVITLNDRGRHIPTHGGHASLSPSPSQEIRGPCMVIPINNLNPQVWLHYINHWSYFLGGWPFPFTGQNNLPSFDHGTQPWHNRELRLNEP